MTHQLTFIPPAQAEALYDAALDDQLQGRRSPAAPLSRPMEDWDDGPGVEKDESERLAATKRRLISAQIAELGSRRR